MPQTHRPPTAILDTRGLLCPEPVMMLHGKVRELASGDVLRVLASDPSTRRDIPKFCHFLGHELLKQSEQDGAFEYWLRIAQ
ncbi:sulfurtransferase TusA [Ventosimonas gracilis]|uniref:Sulfur carrier protein TusA n=1 Tax=Ventosimonas gracilis TaxID=1680762 RepID=A0A139SUX6_9GAMM|nr:sulfurtransferase TusA [Ventosimonas gracilis]KXU38369.1 sulfurtransferase TusA [Ventosimonas gracilis]